VGQARFYLDTERRKRKRVKGVSHSTVIAEKEKAVDLNNTTAKNGGPLSLTRGEIPYFSIKNVVN
jgi:hypothetical protein